KHNNADNVCNTEQCRDEAALVLSKIKAEVNPCDDFFEFACGSFIDKAIIPDDESSISQFTVVNDKLLEQLRDIVTAKQPDNAPKHFQQPSVLYKACMNKTRIESLGSTPVAKLAKSLGGWPLIEGDKWNANYTWTWQEQIKKFRAAGFDTNYIIDFTVQVDLQNSSKRIINLDQASLGITLEYMRKGFTDTVVSAYYVYMVDVAVLFGAQKDEAKQQMLQSLEFEMALANISWPNERRRNYSDLYNPYTPQQLQHLYPYADWMDYLNALLPAGLSVHEDEAINLSVPTYLEQLGKLLAKTPNRVIANYLMWRIHKFSILFISDEFRSRQQQFLKVLTGRQKQEPRWKGCIDIVNTKFEISMAAMYVRQHFNSDTKGKVLELVNDVRGVFNEILDEVNWMDDKTRLEAVKKLHSVHAHIAYPDELLDDEKLAKFYENLEIHPDQYFESSLALKMFDSEYMLNQLRLPVNKTEWIRHARSTVVDAYYSNEENSIELPAAVLQGHYYNANRPNYMNFGGIGNFIGHEFTHGFDDMGSQFDLAGNKRDWWQPDTKKAYLEKAQCIIHQYGNFTEPRTGLKINGIHTQGENIADNGGVKEAYKAYHRWVEKHGSEPRLPDLDYTPQQMFWIAAGQVWCSKVRKEYLSLAITVDEHSPWQYRVLGPLRNSNDFAKDFQCPTGSPMNPVHKCEVW
ncbi:hypothetical protein KR044_004215, partial [Drosophila immigrans]